MKKIWAIFGVRSEAVAMGIVKLVGTDRKAIVENVSTLPTNERVYAAWRTQSIPVVTVGPADGLWRCANGS